MHWFGRPRLAAVFPILAVVAAAALLLLVALSLALQPPESTGTGAFDHTLAWARAVSLAGASLAFLVGIVAFARVRDEVDNEPADVQGMLLQPSRTAAAGAPPAPPIDQGPFRFTLIAVGKNSEDVRAIADFEDPRELLLAMQAWQEESPAEQLRIFGPDGIEIARRRPVPARATVPFGGALLRRRARPGLATGGA